MRIKTLPIFLAFLCMGFGDAVGPFVGLAKQKFALSNTVAQLIQFMGFIMFGILSIPMGIYQDKKGKKFILMLGLLIALLGLVIPILGGLSSFGLFLLTVLLLGAGATTLQVAGNPIMRDVSAEGSYSRNLSLGQFVKAIGSLTGPVIPAVAASYFNTDWIILFPIYSAFLLLTLVTVGMLNIEESKPADKTASFSSCFKLLKDKYVLMMVLGIFLYVGAEQSMSSGIPLYLESEFGVDIEKLGVLGTGFFFTALMIGRFLGGIIMKWLDPKKFYIITSIISIVSILGLFVHNEVIATISVFLIGLGFANIFPLIFSITVDKMPERSNELSGLMVTAIVGGAFIPMLRGIVADLSNNTLSFIVPLLVVFYLTYTAFYTYKRA